MQKSLIKKVLTSAVSGQTAISALSSKQKSQLEKSWDVEHAYYSSALEGSKLDRNEFEKLAEKVS